VLSIYQDRTVCETIEKIALDYGATHDLSFANGGDQNNNTIPERSICDQMGITLVLDWVLKYSLVVGCLKSNFF
tara:strand:+ start:1141 stop:1362 length:222 start_codon:yes stop_codon:yes gene_type:complete